MTMRIMVLSTNDFVRMFILNLTVFFMNRFRLNRDGTYEMINARQMLTVIDKQLLMYVDEYDKNFCMLQTNRDDSRRPREKSLLNRISIMAMINTNMSAIDKYNRKRSVGDDRIRFLANINVLSALLTMPKHRITIGSDTRSLFIKIEFKPILMFLIFFTPRIAVASSIFFF